MAVKDVAIKFIPIKAILIPMPYCRNGILLDEIKSLKRRYLWMWSTFFMMKGIQPFPSMTLTPRFSRGS
jgi:hypothetical protein